MKDITLLDLLKSGAHFGHNTSRWNPKMKPYIFTARSGIHILDLEKTKQKLEAAAKFAKEVVQKGGIVLFVGTKKQTREIVKAAAVNCSMPYVNIRWLGGTFTNYKTIQKTIRKLERLENLKATGELESKYTKKERLLIEREIANLRKLFEGIAGLKRLPDVVFVTDVKHEDIAVKEAKKSRIKTIGIVDTNCSPDNIDYVIPCNDDATKAVELVCGAVSEAIREGRQAAPQPVVSPAVAKVETK